MEYTEYTVLRSGEGQGGLADLVDSGAAWKTCKASQPTILFIMTTTAIACLLLPAVNTHAADARISAEGPEGRVVSAKDWIPMCLLSASTGIFWDC